MLEKLKNLSKKNKIIMASVLAAICALFILGNIGNHNDDTDTTQSGSSSKGITLSSALSSNKRRLWYSLVLPEHTASDDRLASDVIVAMVYVVEDGKMTAYQTHHVGNTDGKDNLLISDIQNMSDDEIIKESQKLDKRVFELDKADEKKAFDKFNLNNIYDNDRISYYKDRIEKGRASLADVKYQKPKAQAVNIIAYHTSSSQTPTKESLLISHHQLDGGLPVDHEGSPYVDYSNKNTEYEIPFGYSMTYNQTVDDTNFAGFNYTFFTKVKNSKAYYSLDDNVNSNLITKSKII
ncbi:hypothetical protein [Fructobacillus ficulneus]|uniref:Erythromycin resistance ATP-binding protein n=1 Tax=Fructobacillus ficulneus TaxID=157463 RepID=A0A0K8MIK6_9LACO|nr:hypothetical protein [Fructobacillus ficulneus]GAO99714.1 erythromycin resistance ATP-binding protein [Fructobacillus ficulneus]